MNFTKFLLFLTIFATPLYVVRFQIGPFPTTLLEILILLTALSWALEFSLIHRRLKPASLIEGIGVFSRLAAFMPRFLKNSPKKFFCLLFTAYYLPFLLFLLSASIAFLISSDKHNAFGTYKAYVIEPIIIYLIITSAIKTKKDTEKLIKAMIASGVFVSLWVISQAAFGWFPRSAGFITNPQEAALGRAHGPYNTANAVGLYLGPIFALTLVFLSSVILTPSTRGKDPPRVRDLAFARDSSSLKLLRMTARVGVVALLLIAILLSKSTGALIATTAVILCFFLLTRYQANKISIPPFYLLFTVYCLLPLIFFFLIVPTLTPKTSWARVRPENYTTTTIRLCLWEGTRKMLLERPVFGAGLSGFKELYAEKYTTCDSEPLEYPHNLILNFWVEMGILGMISFLWLVWRAVKPTLSFERLRSPRNTLEVFSGLTSKVGELASGRVEKPQNSSRRAPLARTVKTNNVALGVTLAFVYILIHGLVDVPYFKNDLSLQFWLLFALSEFQTKKSRALDQSL